MNKSYLFNTEVLLIPAMHAVDEIHAADLLRQQLGQNQEHWLAFLHEDRESDVPDEGKQIPSTELDGNYWYDICDIYTYIVNQEPGALMIATPGNPSDVVISDPGVESCAAIYTANRTRFAVRLILSDGFMKFPWLSANCARELGERLIELADWSDRHRYTPETLMFQISERSVHGDSIGVRI